MKRLFDALVATAGLFALAPLFGLVMVAVVICDGRPIFFGQTRIGKRGQQFTMWKFRTMVNGSDRRGNRLTVGADPRITRIGHWLRKYKIDELPQLWNVVRGEMSLVGPRPEVPEYVERYAPNERRVLELMPGITDPASICYFDEAAVLAASPEPERCYVEEVMPRKISINLEYGARRHVFSDLLIVLRTVARIFG
jgi:lipopolysaccharide/colanic/teichoic acid biosynthesis glycosyltransferase